MDLRAGFVPDPHVTTVVAGGTLEPTMDPCRFGYVAESPSVRLTYAATRGTVLHLYAVSATDVTLLVRLPDGTWRCDDDSLGGTNPIVTLAEPPAGAYDIWVGTFQPETGTAELRISEIQPPRTDRVSMVTGDFQHDSSLAPTHGTIRLATGFTPDPREVEITAGGTLRVALEGCQFGIVGAAPDVRLEHTGGSLPLILAATSSIDVTLLVRQPDGSWLCDDDSNGDLNPALTIAAPRPGRYDIWVGTYGGEPGPAVLQISGRR